MTVSQSLTVNTNGLRVSWGEGILYRFRHLVPLTSLSLSRDVKSDRGPGSRCFFLRRTLPRQPSLTSVPASSVGSGRTPESREREGQRFLPTDSKSKSDLIRLFCVCFFSPSPSPLPYRVRTKRKIIESVSRSLVKITL